MKPNTVCYIVNARNPENNGKFVTTVRICMKNDVLPDGTKIELNEDVETWIVNGNAIVQSNIYTGMKTPHNHAAVRLSRLRPIDGSSGIEDKTVKELEYVR